MKLSILSLVVIALSAKEVSTQSLNETYNTGVFAPENVRGFSAYHNRLFFEDCDQYVDTFAPEETFVQFCDGFDPCFTTRAGVVEVCERTVGRDNNLHGNLTVLPRSSPWPFYQEVLVIGKQSFCENIGMDVGFGPVTPLCFDFAAELKLQQNDAKTFGLEIVSSRGFYDIAFGSCPGFQPVICNGEETPTEDVSMASTDGDDGDSSAFPMVSLLWLATLSLTTLSVFW